MTPAAVGLADELASLGLFSDLEPAARERLAASADEVLFGEGEWIIRAGDRCPTFYVVVEGEAAIVIDEAERAVVPRGGFFGEISILLGEPATASVVTRSPMRCLAVPGEQLEEFLVANPRVLYRMLQTELRRLKSADERRA